LQTCELLPSGEPDERVFQRGVAGLLAQGRRRAARHDTSLRDEYDGVAERPDVVEDVTREDDAHSALAHVAQGGLEAARRRDVEAVGGLVEQQVPRRMNDRADPVRMLSVVVLPAPFSPSSPVIWPSGAANDTPASAVTGPNRMCRS
jgi:hypothetical protein